MGLEVVAVSSNVFFHLYMENTNTLESFIIGTKNKEVLRISKGMKISFLETEVTYTTPHHQEHKMCN